MTRYGKLLALGGSLAALVTLGGCAGGIGSEDASDPRMTGMNGPRAGFDWPSPVPEAPAPTAPAVHATP